MKDVFQPAGNTVEANERSLPNGAPIGTQRSGSDGERRHSGMSEPRRLRRGEQYGACADTFHVKHREVIF